MKREELKLIIKECIIEIREDNINIEEGVFDKDIKNLKELKKKILEYLKKLREKKKKSPSQDNTPPKRRELTKEEISEMEKDYSELLTTIKKVISKMKNTSDYKNLCKECCEKYNKYYGYDDEVKNDKFIPKLIVDDFESINSIYLDAIIEIIDEEQTVRVYFSDILYMIVKLLKEWFPDTYNKFSYSYGDGDEGCLYVSYIKEFE